MSARLACSRARATIVSAVVVLTVAAASTSTVASAQSATPHRSDRVQNADWGAGVPGASACDPLDPSGCMLPFPSDYYSVPDSSMPSGRRVVFPVAAMPESTAGVPVDPTPYERNDGFSPGSAILVHVPGIDLARSHIPGNGFIQQSLAPDAGVVLVDERTGRKLAYWGELDARDRNPATRLLMIHPAWNLPEGDRIAVGLKDLETSTGARIEPRGAFAQIISGGAPPSGLTSALAGHVDQVVGLLSSHGVRRSSLFLAWDFTVESTQNLTGWAVHMRDVAMGQLGSAGVPRFAVTQVSNYTPSQNRYLSREVVGTIQVPSFLDTPGGPPGSVLNFGPDGLPEQLNGETLNAVFACNIPRSDDTDPSAPSTTVRPGRPVLYGVGLFGVATDTSGENIWPTAQRYDMVTCSTNWMGLSGDDVAYDAQMLPDLSLFPSIPDRLLQSLIDALYLARAMSSPRGFDSNADFRPVAAAGSVPAESSARGGRASGGSSSGSSEGSSGFIATGVPLTYYGNSEGSLAGGALTAISTEFRRSVLGVPSMDYDVLLDRSVDFSPFFGLLSSSYPQPAEQQVIFDVLEMLWDRGETDGYAEQLTNHPLPGTPPHQVLLQMGFGDHQVSNYTTETEARTIGASVHQPVLRQGREPGNPFYGIPAITTEPYEGPAALYVWDPGVPAPPPGDIAPTRGPDPHDTIPRTLRAAEGQLNHFQLTGQVVNVCGADPCRAPAPSGQ